MHVHVYMYADDSATSITDIKISILGLGETVTIII